ncbi:ead/Ea22-like family protein [Salmonella enterica]|nr:ead/Ea22-like family protein [Salmonella enterica]EHE6890059.1 ead/Ea22-like family protein [Salmonella enterica]EIM3792435.1 ead/Ea22-like family protein [Salmonella enterica]
MSNIDKQALRERYSPKPVPKCHICGEEMTIQRMSASRITSGCTGEGDDGYFKFGRTFADEHYEKSRVTVVDVSDPDVLALLDENLQLQREKDAIEAVALALRDDMRQAREQLEAAEKRNAEQQRSLDHRKFLLLSADEVQRDFAEALGCAGDNESIMEAIDDLKQHIAELESKNGNLRTIAHEQNELAIKANLDSINDAVEMNRLHKRIAELEVREVNLSKLSVGEVMHMSGFSRDYAEGWCAGNDNAIHEIRTAGIKVKGE